MTKKLYRSITIRALSILLVGALTIAFPTNATRYLVMSIGLLFLIPGILSVAAYLINRKKLAKKDDGEEKDNQTDNKHLSYLPIIALGSVLFGTILLSFPSAFKDILIYILGAFIVVAAAAQAFNIYRLSKVYKVSFFSYIVSALIGIAGITVIALNYNAQFAEYPAEKTTEPTSIPSLIMGIACVVYGLSEIAYALYFRKPTMKELPTQEEEKTEEVTVEAEIID